MMQFFRIMQSIVNGLSIKLIGCFICGLWLSAAVSWADGDTLDYLTRPASFYKRAIHSVMMDVSTAGECLCAVGERGFILLSDDNGDSWTQSKVPTMVTLNAVNFPTAQHGWAVGHQGVVLHSSDGGKTWEKQIDGNFVNKSMLSEVSRLLERKELEVKTAEGDIKEELEAQIFELKFLISDWGAAEKEGPSHPFMDVCFMNEQRGIAVGSFGIFFETNDGGKTWRPVLDATGNYSGYHYYGIAQSNRWIFLAGEAGMILRSDDEGKTWEHLESPYSGTFFGVTCDADGSNIVVYGLRGNVFRSTDGGETWQTSDFPSKISVQGGAFFDNGSVWLVTVNGTLYRSDDAGKSFAGIESYMCRYPACNIAGLGINEQTLPMVTPKTPPGAISIEETENGMVLVAGLKGLTVVNPDNTDNLVIDER